MQWLKAKLTKQWFAFAACAILGAVIIAFSVFYGNKQHPQTQHVLTAKVQQLASVAKTYSAQGAANSNHASNPSQSAEISLPDPWSAYSPQQSGVYQYTVSFELTAAQIETPQAVYIPRLGNRYALAFNNTPLPGKGQLNQTQQDYAHEPYFAPLPASALRAGQNLLHIVVAGEENRFAGLSSLWVGDASVLQRKFDSQGAIQIFSSWVIIWVSASLGGLAWVVAYYAKMRYLVVFGLGAMAWALRTSFLVVSQVFVDYRIFLFSYDVLFAIAVLCFVVAAVNAVKIRAPQLKKIVTIYLGLAPVLSALFALGVPYARTALMLQMLLLVAYVFYAYLKNRPSKSNHNSFALKVAFLIAILFGIYDFVVILRMKIGYELFSLSKFSILLTAIALASIFGKRLFDVNQHIRESHQKINTRLRATRARLSEEYQQRAAQERVKILTQERWRMMQDMHDGLGGQLVSLHQAVSAPAIDQSFLIKQVKQTMDTLRMTVNAVTQNHTQISFMLGSIRERLDFLCNQHGKKLIWWVDDIPELSTIDALKINGLEKMVLEIFTNIAKHSTGTQVSLNAGYSHSEGVWIKITENGEGFCLSTALAQVAPFEGRGLVGLVQRARSIEAELTFNSQATEVKIAFQLSGT